MKRIIIIGAGGQGREASQLIKDINRHHHTWELLGYIDDNQDIVGQQINGVKVLGTLNHLKEYRGEQIFVVCAIGSSVVRKKITDRMEKECGPLKYAVLIHPTSVVSDYSDISEGTMICANTVVSTNVKLGSHVIINYGSTIGHDTSAADYSTVLPGSHISGNVQIGEASELGTGSSVIPNVTIGSYSIIGAGAVVISSLPDQCTAVGVPAKAIKFSYKKQ